MVRHAMTALMFLLLAAAPAAARGLGADSVPQPPLAKPVLPPPEERTSPYPANYAEDIAQQLGVKNGRMDLFEMRPKDDRDGLMPSLSGSLGGEGAMIKLKWKP
jgi:hypothetical protein